MLAVVARRLLAKLKDVCDASHDRARDLVGQPLKTLAAALSDVQRAKLIP